MLPMVESRPVLTSANWRLAGKRNPKL